MRVKKRGLKVESQRMKELERVLEGDRQIKSYRDRECNQERMFERNGGLEKKRVRDKELERGLGRKS